MKLFTKGFKIIIIGFLVFGSLSQTVLGAANTLSATFNKDNSERLTAADSADLSRTGSFTIDFWAKFTTVNTLSFIVDKTSPTSGDQGYTIYHQASDNTMHLVTSQSGTGQDKNVAWTPSTATWYVLRWTYNAATDEGQFYAGTSCPGDIVGTTTGHTDPSDGANVFYLGAQKDNETTAGRLFNGSMDEVRIWGEVHTTDDQCTQLNGNETNLLAVWMMNGTSGDCAGTSLEDKGETTDPAGAGADDLTNVNTVQCTTDVPFGAAVAAVILKRRRIGSLIIE